MEAFKIIFMLLFCICYCNGHFFKRNYIDRQSQAFPSLNFQTFPEYFKPLYRIRYMSPSTTTAKSIQPHTPKPTRVNNIKKQTTPLKQHGNGLLSIIKNVMKPLMGKKENPQEMVNQRMKGRGPMYDHHRNHAIHLKLIPKLVKKEVAKQLGTILGKIQKDAVANNTKKEINKIEESKVEAIDLTSNKENTSTENPKLNETNEEEIKKKTGYINKIEAKSIFGNFVGNKHFANIFIFYPNNDNSALVVGLKDNLTQSFTENPAEILTKTPIDKLVDKTTENSISDDGKDLVGTKDDESSNDKANNTEVVVTTDSITTTAATLTTTGITINQDNGNKDTDDDDDYLSGDKENVDEATKDNDSKTTEDSSMTSMSISTTTELLSTSKDDPAVDDQLTVSPSIDLTEKPDDVNDNILTVAPSTVLNEVSETSSESITDGKDESEDDKNVVDKDITINQDNDNNNTDDDDDYLSSDKENVDEAIKDNDSKTTEDSSMTSMSISTTTELLSTSKDDPAVDDQLTVRPSIDLSEKPDNVNENISTVAPSTVGSEVPESSSESITDVKDESEDEKNVVDKENSEFEDKIIENVVDSTVIPTTMLDQTSESTLENITEKFNGIKEDEIINDKGTDEFNDTTQDTTVESTVVPNESTVTPDTVTGASTTEGTNVTKTEVPTETIIEADTENTNVTSTEVPTETITEADTENTNVTSTEVPTDTIIEADTENTNVTSTEVPTSTESNAEVTTDTTSEGNISSNSTTESTTIDLGDILSTVDDKSSTENFDNAVDSLEETTDSDYMEIEYTYF